MSIDFTGRVVLITGATRGIGRALSLAFAERGATIVGTARNPEPATELAKEIAELGSTFTFVEADAGSWADCQTVAAAAVEHHGRIDVLINNAGTSLPQVRIDLIEEDQWRAVAGPTLDGPLFMSRAVLPTMRAQNDGVIINVASGAGIQALATMGAYGMAKAAAIQLARVIAVENAEFGVRANALIVGAVATELSLASLVARGQDTFGPDWTPPAPAPDATGSPMDAVMIPPEALADSVLMLCARESREINGAVIAIDRGFSAGAYNSAFVGLAAAGLLPG
ncbi:MAG TPA: SDR family oxidoreductase [Mycobacteriales bacterium]|jgi:NAD(P)-dependent dehydrogenase (short-subunit alcohol dehydrogenase family)|nr:SDR family oxidoreductase [Mycobacteriales bacterium]